MKYLHPIVHATDLDASLRFYRDTLGLEVTRQRDVPAGPFTRVCLAAPGQPEAEIEPTHNGDPETHTGGRSFGHVAYAVDDLYAACDTLSAQRVVINRPPHDGRMAFVRSPDGISVELLQSGRALAPAEPWTSMPNVGTW